MSLSGILLELGGGFNRMPQSLVAERRALAYNSICGLPSVREFSEIDSCDPES